MSSSASMTAEKLQMRGNGVMGLDVGLAGLGNGRYYKAQCKEYWAYSAR